MLTTIICIILSILILTGLVTVNTRAVTEEKRMNPITDEAKDLPDEPKDDSKSDENSEREDSSFEDVKRQNVEENESMMTDDEYRQVLKNFLKPLPTEEEVSSNPESSASKEDHIKDEQYREALRSMGHRQKQ
jgi:hypothetical protein